MKLSACLAFFLALGGPAAAQCPDRGGIGRPSTLETGLALGCHGAPDFPGFVLYTPPHRAYAVVPGSTPGPAHALPRWIARFRCTGLWVVPVVVHDVGVYGEVYDVASIACR